MPSYVEIEYDCHGHTTRECDHTDSWDRGDTSTTWYVTGVKLVDKVGYKVIAYPGELKPGDTINLLYAVYSTGDSFGSDEDGSIEFISVHKDAELAFKNKTKLKNDHDTIIHDDGTEEKIYVPWNGYFESLSYLSVDQFILK